MHPYIYNIYTRVCVCGVCAGEIHAWLCNQGHPSTPGARPALVADYRPILGLTDCLVDLAFDRI